MKLDIFDGKSLQRYNNVSNYYFTLRFLVITFEDNNNNNNKAYVKLSEVKNIKTSTI